MTSAFTILSPTINYRTALDAIQSSHAGDISVEGKSDSWQQIELVFPGKRLTLTSLVREKPGDRFSKLILSMHNFFRSIETVAAWNKNYLLNRIEVTKMMIGVVAEPDFYLDDSRFDYLWVVAERLDALIFNGESMLDLQGRRILSQSGEYDVVLQD